MSAIFKRRVPFFGAMTAPAGTVNWTYVQSASTNVSGASSAALAFPGNVTRGNVLVVTGFAHTGGTVQTLSVSDSKLFAYTQAVDSGWSATDNSRLVQWFTRVQSAGADTVTITPSSPPANLFLAIHEFSPGSSPVGLTVTVDGTASSTPTTNTTTPSCGTIAVTGAKDLAVCAIGVGSATGAAIYTAGTGWTLDVRQGGSPWGATEYQLNIASGVTGNMSVDISAAWLTVGATYSAH